MSVDVRPEAGPREHPPVSDLLLWTSVLLGPFAFLLALQISYVMVDWACSTGNDWALHIVNAAALLVATAGALLGRALWSRMGGGWPDTGAGSDSRSRFLAALGALGGVLFALTIIAQWITVAVLGACPRA